MGWYDDIDKVEGTDTCLRLMPGTYGLRLEQVKERKDTFIVEATITKSDNPERPEGTRIEWMVGTKDEMDLVDVKSFLAAAHNIPQGSIKGTHVEAAIGEDNPLAGTAIKARAWARPSGYVAVQWKAIK